MSSITSDSGIPTTTSSGFSPAQSSILPYSEGLTGVNLWLNSILSNALYVSIAFIAVLVFSFRLAQIIDARVRFLATLNLPKDKQFFWTQAGSFGPWMKKNFLTAPLIHKRHNKEVQLSTAANFGTIPSRLHTVFLGFYFLSNIAYCCALDYNHQSKASLYAEARGRTGHLAVMNMLFLFVFAARNNPFIPLLGVSFDTFNLFHRWVGRVVVIESLLHTWFWGVNNYNARGWDAMTDHLRHDLFLIYGLIATIAMAVILFQSVSVIRHAFYESFLHLHQILAAASVVGIILHCESEKLPQIPFMYALVGLWGLERLIRLGRMLYRRGTTIRVEALDGGACRVTFDVRGTWTKTPGRHIFAYIPSVSFWMSHPFSVAWVERGTNEIRSSTPALNHSRSARTLVASPSNDTEADFLPLPVERSRTRISCIMASRTGMTAALYQRARNSPTGVISLPAFVEGPYGGLENMRSYGTVLLFAGGVGITHQLSILHDLASAFADGTSPTRKVILVWSVREIEQLQWVGIWLEEILHMPRRECELKILLYVTRTSIDEDSDGAVVKEIGFTEHVTFGRANVRKLVNREFEERVGAMSVGVCGPGGLADDVRSASRAVMEFGNVDFHEESFTW